MANPLVDVFSRVHSVINTRYVNKFVPVKQEFDEVVYVILTAQQEEIVKDVLEMVQALLALKDKYPQLHELKETIFLRVQDLDNFCVMVHLNKGSFEVRAGWKKEDMPSFIIPLFVQNIENLLKLARSGNVPLESAYRMVRVLFIPFLRGLYQGNYENIPKDKSYLELDNFLQIEVQDEFGKAVEGFPGTPKATAVNVDGQWLVFEGFQGDPDVRYHMTVLEAIRFAYLVRVKLVNASVAELPGVVAEYVALKKKVTVYERAWHNVEEVK